VSGEVLGLINRTIHGVPRGGTVSPQHTETKIFAELDLRNLRFQPAFSRKFRPDNGPVGANRTIHGVPRGGTVSPSHYLSGEVMVLSGGMRF